MPIILNTYSINNQAFPLVVDTCLATLNIPLITLVVCSVGLLWLVVVRGVLFVVVLLLVVVHVCCCVLGVLVLAFVVPFCRNSSYFLILFVVLE